MSDTPDIFAELSNRHNSAFEEKIYIFLDLYGKDGTLRQTVCKSYALPAESNLNVTDLTIHPDENLRMGARLRLLIMSENFIPLFTERVEIGTRYTVAQLRGVLRSQEQEILSDTQAEQQKEGSVMYGFVRG